MKEVSSAEVLRILEERITAGLHVDSRLLREVARPGTMFLMPLPRSEDFLRLVWQSIDDARPVVPVGTSRTVRDCARRLQSFSWSFRRLVESGYPWFEKCIAIDEAFDHRKMGWITVTPLNEHEKRETAEGTYYVHDGVHKSLVLAKKLLLGEIEYEPLESLLLTPRRS